ncbi:MAG TPA: hypothetical protein PK733_11920 [Clostridiales bacterium]|nr:hypothetical protein [Clostridiales bacterium]
MNDLNKFKEAISDFFKKNKSLVYLVPLLMVLLIIVIVLYSCGDKAATVNANKTQNPTTNQTTNNKSNATGNDKVEVSGNKVEVLPQTERTADKENQNVKTNSNENKNTSNPVNPFDLPMRLSGVLTGSNDGSIAIIEISQNSYIVREGEVINNTWKVSKIEENGVLLVNGEKESYITFSD